MFPPFLGISRVLRVRMSVSFQSNKGKIVKMSLIVIGITCTLQRYIFFYLLTITYFGGSTIIYVMKQ